MNPPVSVEVLKNYILREIPKARFMDFGFLYENDNGEYVVLNDIRMADIHLTSLVYFHCLHLQVLRAYCTFASKQAVSITLYGPCPNNKTHTHQQLGRSLISLCKKRFFTPFLCIRHT